MALDLVHERRVRDGILTQRGALRSHLRQHAVRPCEPGVVNQELRERSLQHVHTPLQIAKVFDHLGVYPLDGSLPSLGEIAHQLGSLLKRRRRASVALGGTLLRVVDKLDERPEVIGEFFLDESIGLRRELFVEELEGFVDERLPPAVLVVLEENRSRLPHDRADGIKVVEQEHRAALLPRELLGQLLQQRVHREPQSLQVAVQLSVADEPVGFPAGQRASAAERNHGRRKLGVPPRHVMRPDVILEHGVDVGGQN